MSAAKPLIGVLGLATPGHAELVRKAGGRPIRRELSGVRPTGGTALRREWIADQAEVSCSGIELDALLAGPAQTEELAGLLLAALRLDLPAVFVPESHRALDAAIYAMGLAPANEEPATVAVNVACGDGPRPKDLIDGFSLANAVRAGLAAGGGPELLVHLAAVAREAKEIGFPQTARVLAPESPEVYDREERHAEPFDRTRIPGLLALLGDDLHDVETVEGKKLFDTLPEPVKQNTAEKTRLSFVAGRSSGIEAVAMSPEGVQEAAGTCRVFGSEDAAVAAVTGGGVEAGELIVLAGCGVRGAPGLSRLEDLGAALQAAAVRVPVLTDGLPPERPGDGSAWISLFAPEAAAGGVIGRLRDGDFLRFDFADGRIRTSIPARELENRERFAAQPRPGFDYASRYARSALPALAGAGFG